jgi:hypothetical protein
MKIHDEPMECPTWEILLKWIEGELLADDAKLAVHAASCSTCKERFDLLDALGETLTRPER